MTQTTTQTTTFSTADVSAFQENSFVTIKFKNIGYRKIVTGVVSKEREPYKRFKTRDGYAVDLNVLRKGQPWQIVLCGQDMQEAITHGDFFDEDTEQWVKFPKLKNQTFYIATGKFSLKPMEDGTDRPELAVFEPSQFIERTVENRPPRPSQVAKRKATNKSNARKTIKRVIKAKSKKGKATPRAAV